MGGSIGFESIGTAAAAASGSSCRSSVTAEAGPAPEPASGGAAPGNADAPQNVIAFDDPFLRHRARVRSLQILIADDHAANRMVLQRMLQKAGHRVVSVDSGEDVLDALEATDYDAVIVDLHMPGLSGLDLLRQLRDHAGGGGARTPVLVLSADVTPESIQRLPAGRRARLPAQAGGRGAAARYAGRDRHPTGRSAPPLPPCAANCR